MDPITKALHETWKSIVNEGKRFNSDGTPASKFEIGYEADPGGYITGDRKHDDSWEEIKPSIKYGFGIDPWTGKPKKEFRKKVIEPSGTQPAKTPYSDRAGDAPEPAKTPYSDRAGAGGLGGFTGKLGSGLGLGGLSNLLKNTSYRPQTGKIFNTNSPSDVLSIVPKTSKNMFSSALNLMPKIYEERDAEGQMAKGELMNLASKAQELANMMKDDTQLEAWVQSKITKAKDYISSVHDYMNGNPDKID